MALLCTKAFNTNISVTQKRKQGIKTETKQG